MFFNEIKCEPRNSVTLEILRTRTDTPKTWNPTIGPNTNQLYSTMFDVES